MGCGCGVRWIVANMVWRWVCGANIVGWIEWGGVGEGGDGLWMEYWARTEGASGMRCCGVEMRWCGLGDGAEGKGWRVGEGWEGGARVGGIG